jgi:hypothetical protein
LCSLRSFTTDYSLFVNKARIHYLEEVNIGIDIELGMDDTGGTISALTSFWVETFVFLNRIYSVSVPLSFLISESIIILG